MLPPKFYMVGSKCLWELRILRDIEFPEGTTKIGDEWFKNSDVNEVIIPESVIEIGASAFEKCRHLLMVYLRDNSQLKTIRKNCFYQSGLKNISFPINVEDIEPDAFSGCQKLSSIALKVN